MPVYSMTGYASVQSSHETVDEAANTPTWRLHLELRAVNSRFLDLTFKLPEELRPYESALRELLQKHIKRGKLELRGSLENTQAAQASAAAPNANVLQQLARAQDTVLTWLPQARPLSVGEILRLGQGSAQASLDSDTLQKWLLATAQQLLDQFKQARAVEGQQLANSLLARVAGLRSLAQQAEPLIPQLVEQQRQRFIDKWNDALKLAQQSGSSVSPEAAQERALSEATAFAIRIDVAEEITRLQSHLNTIDDLLSKGNDMGKRLEFLIQELHREANTLGSKSATLETSRISVDMKVLIEQMREQVQNLE